MELPNHLHAALAANDPVMAGEFDFRFRRWLESSSRSHSVRHELVIFFHVELSQVKDSIDIRGYLSEELDDVTWVNNFMTYVYSTVSKLWKRSRVGGV